MIDVSGWKEFRVGELFEIVSGKGITKIEVEDDDSLLPAIQSGEENFGRLGYLSEAYCKEKGYVYSLIPCLTVARSGSVGFVGIQDKCVVGDSAKLLLLKTSQNKMVLLFLRACLMMLRGKYSYTDKVTNDKYAAERVKLPVTAFGEPDWTYMEQYMRQVMDDCERKYQLLVKISKEQHPVCVSGWKKFRVGELFDVCHGQRHVANNHDEGDTPYYSASLENNGVTDYIGNPLFVDSDAVVVTTFGDAFWANGMFTASDECTMLKHICMSELSGLFVAAVYMSANKFKYSFSLKAFSGRVINDVIKLPVTASGEPDWTYMEQYMRDVMDRQAYVVRCLKAMQDCA